MLNTSFNLHGYPLVDSPKDAMYVFLNSEIDALLLNNYLIDILSLTPQYLKNYKNS